MLTVTGGGTVNNTYGVIGVASGSTGTATVTGAGSTWTNTSNIFVGYFGSGTLNIEDGGGVNVNTSGYIGEFSGSTGTVTVTGAGSSWTNGSYLSVGNFGTGTLTIQNGGSVSNAHGSIGLNSGSTGTVTVDGAGSSWSNSSNLSVGDSGTGTLTIQNGGKVDNVIGHIGYNTSSTGTVTVDGAGSSWTNSGLLYVGGTGTGALTILNGGKVSDTTGAIGYRSGSTGTVTVAGAGSSWTNDTFLSVGYYGTGALKIEGGGSVDNIYGYIGANSGSVGTAVVNGGDSTWTNSGTLTIGQAGEGTLSIEDGGVVSDTIGYIGFSRGSIGKVTVTGGGSTWTNSSELIVGYFGAGMLTVAEGGMVSNGAGYIGFNVDSTGMATVTGAGSTWANSGNLTIGNGGTGTLAVEAGGAVSNGFGYVGTGAGANGVVTVTGPASKWTNIYSLFVGDAGGSGTLLIEGGGTVSNGYGVIGSGTGIDTNGAVTVAGENSKWSNLGDLNLGNSGTGTLSIKDGGSVITGRAGFVGYGVGGFGTVAVSGAGSSWESSLYLSVGVFGNGELAIEDGGRVSSTGGIVGDFTGSRGSATIRGIGSAWTNSDTLYVGFHGTGILSVEAGGNVSNTGSYIGHNAGSTGIATVTGAGSTWANSAELLVGHLGAGTINIADGGRVSVGNGSGAVRLGSSSFEGSPGTGTINVGAASTVPTDVTGAGSLAAARIEFGDGNGALNFNHTDDNHMFATALQSVGVGMHSLNHYAGTTLLTGDSSSFAGTTTVSGGTLVVVNKLGGSASVSGGGLQADGTFVGNVAASNTGVVTGSGTITGDVTFSGGVLEGRQGQPLRIGGDLALDGASAVNVALGGAPTAALFDVGGKLTLDGTLNVSDQGGFGAGIYRLFDYGGTLTDNGLAIGALPAGVSADNLTVQTSVKGEVNLASTVGVTLGFWDGGNTALHGNGAIDGGAGVWRSDGRNWTGVDGALNGPYQPNPTFAVFQGSAGTVTVGGSAGAIGVTGMQFASNGYRVEGEAIALQGAGGESIIRVGDGSPAGAGMTATIASALTGDTILVKSDHGTLILTGDNSYTGGTRIDSGTLLVSSDASLGAVAGGLAFNGGTLATTAGFDSGRAITLYATGRFDIASGTQLGLGGTVGGTGHLVKQGAGTLILTGTNTYTGNTLVEAGTLIGNASSIRGNVGVAQEATGIFDQMTDAGFSGNVTGLSGSNGAMMKRGAGTLTLAGTSSLDWSVEAGGLASSAERFEGNAAIAGGASFTFDQTANAAYAGVISGAGSFVKNGSGKLLLTGDSSGFGGATRIEAGSLSVNGKLGGSLSVNAGATLTGSGKVGSGSGSAVTIASGGTFAPGNSIGTLTIDGDLTFKAGSRYAVEVNPQGSSSDLILVTGNATLDGGSLAHVGADGGYRPGSSYTILSAQGTLTGRFDSVSSDFAFLTADLAYDYGAGTIALDLSRNDIGFASAGQTRNQIATAGGIDSIGLAARHPVYDAIALLPGDKALIRASFDQLSGEIHASAKSALIEDSHFLRDAATGRIRAAFGSVAGSSLPVMAYSKDGLEPVAPTSERFTVWGQGFGAWGRVDGDGNAARLDRSTGGLLIGADVPAFETWRLGILAGYSRTSFDIDDRASSGSSDNLHLGFYGGAEWGRLGLRTGLAYTWHDIATSRSVAFPGFADRLTGHLGAGTFQTFGELGYRIDTPVAAFEPFANLAYVNLHTDGFVEQGGAAALVGKDQSTDTAFTTLGLRASTSLDLGGVQATARGMLGWRHAFGDSIPLSTLSFAAGNAFTVAGVPIARDSAVLETGLDLNLSPTATLGVSYQGQIGRGAQQHGFKASLAVRF